MKLIQDAIIKISYYWKRYKKLKRLETKEMKSKKRSQAGIKAKVDTNL